MHQLNLDVVHHGRDNVGSVPVEGEPIPLGEDVRESAYGTSQSFVMIAGLCFDEAEHPLDRGQLKDVLTGSCQSHRHHAHDQAYRADFTSSRSNTRIAARNRQAGSGG
jgi:hypothetical protein